MIDVTYIVGYACKEAKILDKVAYVRIGVNSKNETKFYDCAIFNERQRENCKYIKKGDLLYLTGSMNINKFDKERPSLQLNVNFFYIIPRGKKKEGGSPQEDGYNEFGEKIGESVIMDDDIPF